MTAPIVPERTGTPEGIRMLSAGAAIVACLVGVYFVRDVVAPVFLAMTLVLTVRPLVHWLNGRRVPKMVSALIGMLVVFLVLFAILSAVAVALVQFVAAMPAYADRFNALYSQVSAQLMAWGVSQETITQWVTTFDYTRLLGYLTGVMGQVGFWATFLGSLFLFVAFVSVDLTDTSEGAAKLARVRPNLAAALLDFSWRVRKYWIVNTIFGVCVALINMGILTWLQIPLVVTWGILAFVTAYIPNVGFIIGMVPPALMALLARDFQTMVIMVAAYVVVNFIASMVIQPKVTGDAVGLNITTTFISLVFWSIIIGPLGAILAVPLTLFCKGIFFDADPKTRWLSVFLGGNLDAVVPVTVDPVPPLQAPTVTEHPDVEPEPEPDPEPETEPAEEPGRS
ncbi:MAG: AI-2E family transporter [Micropruina sp.]|uniref:AI-2E family transporter n=1 Tax=Micropruina sp. TaxID=2737536 RepID=UPI0039E3F9C7